MNTLTTHNHRCDFYSRFAAPYTGKDPKYWNTYHRSQKKCIFQVKQSDFTIPSYQETQQDKTGCYRNPFFFQSYEKSLKIKKIEQQEVAPNIYDDLLKYQHQMAEYLCDEINKLETDVQVNCDNDYSCVLVLFPKPKAVKNEADWVNWVSVIYMSICLKLIDERGLNAEIVRRSSFGHIRPSIAETAPSLRINLGIVPKEYVKTLADAIVFTEKLITGTPQKQFNCPVKLAKLKTDIRIYNKARKNSNIKYPETLWDALWQPMDSKNHSFVYQIFRKEGNVECTINQILDSLIETKQPLSAIIKSTSYIKDCFVKPFEDLLAGYKLNQKKQFSISIDLDNLSVKRKWSQKNALIVDNDFSIILKKLLNAFKAKDLLDSKALHLNGLHALIEKNSRELFFNPPKQDCEDGYGSDSEAEDEIEIDDEEPIEIFAKKFITATGMRAIQLAAAASKKYLEQVYSLNFNKAKFFTDTMYYETETALKKHAIPMKQAKISEQAKPLKLVMYDLNYCNTTQKQTPKLSSTFKNSGPIFVLDSTSSTTWQLGKAIKKIFSKQEHIIAIIAVSSGLKNEQAGSDINPYGTIRIFSREREARDLIYNALVKLEQAIDYEHPKCSHLLRKTAKLHGLVPTNEVILQKMKL